MINSKICYYILYKGICSKSKSSFSLKVHSSRYINEINIYTYEIFRNDRASRVNNMSTVPVLKLPVKPFIGFALVENSQSVELSISHISNIFIMVL